MSGLSRAKDRLGRAVFGEKYQGDAPATLAQTATIDAETTIITDSTGTFTQMTPEQIMARNRAILAKVSHNPPAHKKFLEWAKSTWRIIGPIAFIVFTAGEVYYYIKHFLPQDNSIWTQVLLWGITLLIEIPFCIATYDLSARKERAVEAKQSGREVPDKDTPGAIGMWIMMALINIGGQAAFLVFITKVGDFSHDYVAFFLSPAPLEVEHIVKHQKAQGEGFDQLADAATERQIKESRAHMLLEQNQRTMDTERKNANFVARFNDMHAEHMLQQQAELLKIKAPERDM